MSDVTQNADRPSGGKTQRLLNFVEWAGNKLPDPAVLFLIALAATMALSAILSTVSFTEVDPRTVQRDAAGLEISSSQLTVKNQLSGAALAGLLSKMVKIFVEFPPLGVVLVAMLGVGVAEHTGFINAFIKGLLKLTSKSLITPMLILVAIVSHAAGDTGYVLVIPLGGVIFAAAGRHPLAGIAAAFAGVSGGFSASFLPSSLDPLLQGFTQSAAQIIQPGRMVNPLCNYFFTTASSLVIIAVGWFVTDRVIEPRLAATPFESSAESGKSMGEIGPREQRSLWMALGSMAVCLVLLVAASLPATSPLRSASGSLTAHGAPLMEAIVPLIFLLFLVPGVVFGYANGTVSSHRDIIQGMSKSMSTMGYYLVMAFAAAQFTYVFKESNVGALVAIKGANLLKALSLPSQVTVVGIILLTAVVNLLVGSASAKWALLGPIFVPMLMQLGISPELTQVAFRIGDSSTNIITPLLPYFPLIVVYCQKYQKSTGIGSLVAMMLPYSVAFIITWTLLLLAYWAVGLPLGLQSTYTHP